MDFVSTILFLIMYYIRPQEWSGLFSKIRFVMLVMVLSVLSLFFRDRSIRLGDLFKTPHDWMVLAFFTWTVVASPTPIDTFKDVSSLYVFYIVIVQSLTSVERIKIFVGWWTFLIVAIAIIAVASKWGIDPLNCQDLTNGRMKGRLALNLSIFRNPNALGHNVVPCFPMLYYLCIWRRPLFMKEMGALFMILPFYCVYETVSKGSFLSGAVTMLATFMFGRPRYMQILVIVLALMFGTTAVYSLPRMNELAKAKSDPAIQGRVAAFTHGLHMIRTEMHGIGYKNWMVSFFRANHYHKAAHSSYVQVGSELGYPGFFLMFGILYCSLRTLTTATTENDDQERIRRILFVLVVSYMISSWMIDLGYRPTFFMFTAATAALHRILHGIQPDESLTESVPDTAFAPLLPAWRGRLLPQPAAETALHSAGVHASVIALEGGSAATTDSDTEFISRIGGGWNRITLIDLGIIAVMTYGAVRFWAFIITRM